MQLNLPLDMRREWTYYLSGPMTGYENFNYPFFAKTKLVLAESGLTIESPHENPWPPNHQNMTQEELWAYMMVLCYDQMDRSQGIILTRGWPESRGAKVELEYMLENGKPVYYFDDDENRVICMNRKYAAHA